MHINALGSRVKVVTTLIPQCITPAVMETGVQESCEKVGTVFITPIYGGAVGIEYHVEIQREEGAGRGGEEGETKRRTEEEGGEEERER